MKRFILFLLPALFIFQSCSDDTELNRVEAEIQNQNECIVINTFQDLENFVNECLPKEGVIADKNEPTTKSASSWIEYCSAEGCNSVKTIAQNQKFIFSAEVAGIIGVPSSIELLCDIRQGELSVSETSSFEVLRDTSLECGYVPGGTGWTDLGYSMVRRNNQLWFLSNSLHVKYDNLGMQINVHYPKRAEHFVWHFRRYHY